MNDGIRIPLLWQSSSKRNTKNLYVHTKPFQEYALNPMSLEVKCHPLNTRKEKTKGR
jgi:hypothetical protein